MPKLIVDRKQKRKTPPCGRIVEFSAPHSPFQVLIDCSRQEKRISIRELARLVTADGTKLAPSTLYAWLHAKSPAPESSLKKEHVESLARHLGLNPNDIFEAHDASLHRFTPKKDPTPMPAFNALEQFIAVLENDKRQRVSLPYVLNLAKRFRDSAKYTESPVPQG